MSATSRRTTLSLMSLPPELIHPEWKGIYEEPEHTNRLDFTNLDTINNWAVRLQFQSMGQSASGSGFFLNLPPSMLKEEELIFTAAHNLIDPTGKRLQDSELAVFDQSQKELEVVGTWCCPDYIPDAFEHDYAAIRVKRPEGSQSRGFGFSLRLGEIWRVDGQANVTGYRNTEPNKAKTSTGRLGRCYEARIEYHIKTEQGISGSAVWMGYDGYPTAIAIHNRRGQRSSGSRLTPKLLREVFKWVGVGQYSVSLQAVSRPNSDVKLPDKGLYLYFSEDHSFARVKLGPGSVFDVLPAHTRTVPSTAEPLYVLSYEGKWVLFDVGSQKVVLHDQLNARCLFYQQPASAKKPDRVQIVLEHEVGGDGYQLRIQGNEIYEPDDDESSEVSLIRNPSKEAFTLFSFKTTG